jgi:hypothetical protein
VAETFSAAMARKMVTTGERVVTGGAAARDGSRESKILDGIKPLARAWKSPFRDAFIDSALRTRVDVGNVEKLTDSTHDGSHDK